jgi:methionyl-tRNA formyltransferase
MAIFFLGNNKTYPLYKGFVEKTINDEPDMIVSCQFSKLIPKYLIEKYPVVNIHYGLLPRYAGMYPVFWQVREGDKAGVTLHYIDECFDSGDIIDQTIINIGNQTADEVYDVLAVEGVRLLEKHYSGILDGSAPRQKQDIVLRCYRNKSSVDFEKEGFLGLPCPGCELLKDNVIRSICFYNIQYPVIRVGGRDYMLIPKELI